MKRIIGVVMTAAVLSAVTWDSLRSSLTSLPAEAQMKLYKPPLRRAIATRVRSGTRGPGDRLPSLSVLVPDHTGLTLHEQPQLYWYLSQDSPLAVEITLSDTESIDPLLELRLKPPIAAGIHRIRLAEHGIRLQPDVPYEWFVTLLTDSEDPSLEVVSGGTIKRLPPSASRRQQVEAVLKKTATKADTWRIYAASGIWYDAMATLSALIEKRPKDAALRQQRAVLLDEISLPEVAAYIRKHPLKQKLRK